jgi:broad specificity phosphatase PhoE
MTTLIIERQGQASFGTENYDCLSELGRQQARWLGEYYTSRGIVFRRVFAGSLVRQADTAAEIVAGMDPAPDSPVTTESGLNEYDGAALYAAYTGRGDQHVHQRSDFRDYWRTFRAAYESWIDERLSLVSETWPAFNDRIRQALEHGCAGTSGDDAVLVVTSGGDIGCATRPILDAPGRTAIELNFQVRNTAFCEVVVGRRGMRLLSFNSVPHIDRPDRRHAITHV